MTSHPEKLFRDKLQNFQKPAPAAAWERIEANLSKTSNKGLWMKIAAGLVLLAVAGILLWPDASTSSQQDQSVSKTGNETTPLKEVEKRTSKELSTTPVIAEQQKQLPAKANRKTKTIEQPTVVPVIEETQPAVVEKNNLVIEPQQQTTVAVNEQTSVQPAVSKTIVYTADEVNARFLRKKITSDATGEEKKSSGIQKLMGLAYDLKNNENGFGDLRQKKDEILALNFLNKEDTKTEKSKN